MKKIIVIIFSVVLLFINCSENFFAKERVTEPLNIDENIEHKIDKYVEEYIGENIAGAQISVTKDGKEIFYKGYGLSDVENNKPVTISTTFNYGSISKLFIWISAMQLKEKGLLDLNKDIKEYLPVDYPIKTKFEKPITFLNLMNHNAGFDDDYVYDDSNFSSLEEALTGYDVVQCFEPGEVQGYSNFSANLAAFIIERITGMQYYEYVQENIFKVCGMNCCYPEKNPIESVIKNKATGYTHKSNGKFIKTATHYKKWLYPSGSVVGTTNDLSRLAFALMPQNGDRTPLFENNNTLNEMLSISYTPTGEKLFSICHGFWGTDGNHKGIGHTGCVEGMTSNFVFVPEQNLSISVLANDQDAEDITYGVVWMLTGTDYTELCDKSNFPNSKNLNGEYIHVRTKLHNMDYPYTPYIIKSVSKNKIKVTIGDSCQYYKQIRPYIYENISATGGVDFKKKIYFKVDDKEKVIKAVVAKNDLIPIEKMPE